MAKKPKPEKAKTLHDEDALGKAYDSKLLSKLLPFVKPHKALFFGAFSLTLLQVLVELTKPLLVKFAIDEPIKLLAENPELDSAWDTLHMISLVFIGVLAAELFLRYWSGYGLVKLGQRVIFDLRSKLYRHLQSLSLRFYDRNPVGRLVTRTTSDIEAIGEIFSSGLVMILADIIKITVVLVILFALNWQLALLIVAIFPVMFGVTAVFRYRARSAFRVMRIKQAAANSFLNESIGGVSVTRIFAQEERQAAKYRERNSEYLGAALTTVQNFSLFFPAVQLVSTIAIGALLWYGTSLVTGLELQAGEFIAFFLYTESLFRPIREISERYTVLQSAMSSTERVTSLLDEANDVPDSATPVAFDPKTCKGEIEFRDVWFAYKGEQWVLKGVSFRLEPGQALAIVGATGSGKTTIINLLCRFYDIQKGTILLDGVDIRELAKRDLRAALGLVLQDVFLFAGSVLENLRLGDDSISRERVIDAAKTAGASTFIERLDNQFDAPVAERGATFSTGEKQLVAFARALAYEPRILILDEATANIDSETEALIQRGLEKLMEGRTTVAVAHRLSTIKHANQILVMHAGEIVERGTHEELLKMEGRYWRLYMLQFSKDDDEAGETLVSASTRLTPVDSE